MKKHISDSLSVFELRALINSAPHGIVAIQKGQIKFANQAFLKSTGYTLDELSQFSEREIHNLTSKKDLLRIQSYIEKLIAGEEVLPLTDITLNGKSGSHKPVNICGSTLVSEDGLIIFLSVKGNAENKEIHGRICSVKELTPNKNKCLLEVIIENPDNLMRLQDKKVRISEIV